MRDRIAPLVRLRPGPDRDILAVAHGSDTELAYLGWVIKDLSGSWVSKEGVFWPLGSDGEFLKAEASALPSAPALVAHTGIGWCSVKGTVLAL